MPKLISEIKCPKLRKLAELRRKEQKGKWHILGKNNLDIAFDWGSTPLNEGYLWWQVWIDQITELPKSHPLYNEL